MRMKTLLNLRRRLCFTIAIGLLAGAAPLRAQTPVQPPAKTPSVITAKPDTTAADSTHTIRPRTAFIRSLIIPGWGQISAHAYRRAAAFATLQGASWFMLIKTLNKMSDAHKREDALIGSVSDSLRAAMAEDSVLNKKLADPDSFKLAVDSTGSILHIRNLIHSRSEQR